MKDINSDKRAFVIAIMIVDIIGLAIVSAFLFLYGTLYTSERTTALGRVLCGFFSGAILQMASYSLAALIRNGKKLGRK